MGFDIECIVDIHTYPGEYFCPVCRTLVYPNEALQSQCTHLYCKPCLAHIANGSRACPYDGYLVTESDSKLLMESDKALAENIGKVKVHCLFFRSGCTWEGTLSDCSSHCSSCSFGNSPVICNRCGVQLVHRQVHDHAQSCPGVYEAQQAVGGVSGTSTSGMGAPTAEISQTVAQSEAQVSQAPTAQTVAGTLPAGQNPNQPVTAPSQTPSVAAVSVPTPEQWYQQQYQQYYQQHAGYEAFQQQPSQQYYPFQQQPYQQYPQNQVQMQGQVQSHVQIQGQPQQAQPQPQLQPQPQPHSVPQVLQQPHFQSQSQGAQGQNQLLPPPPPQAQSQVQVAAQGQAPAHVPFQPSASSYHVNLQQQTHPSMRPPVNMPPQNQPPPPQGPPTPYAQAVAMRPPAQQPQLPLYQQPNVQMPHPQASQAHVQHQVWPQPQLSSQASNQAHVQIQPQAPMYPTQVQPHLRPSQPNQPPGPPALTQVPQPQVPPVSGHHSYQQPQPSPPMQPGLSHQHPMHPHPPTGPLHPVQAHGQLPQPPVAMRPPQSMPPPQSSASLPPQNHATVVPPSQHHPLPPHPQQPSHPFQHRPVVQPAQHTVPQQYIAQQPFVAPFQGQLHQQGHLPQQQSLQPQLRPYAASHPQQSQNDVSRSMMANTGNHPLTNSQSFGDMGPLPHSGPPQLGLKPTPTSQNYVEPTVQEQNSAEQETRSPPKGLVEKGSEVEIPKGDTLARPHETISDKVEIAVNNGLGKSTRQEEGGMEGSLEQASGGKSLEVKVEPLTDTDSLNQVDLENQEAKLPKSIAIGNFTKRPEVGVSASGKEGHLRPLQSHGSHQQRPQEQVPPQPPSVLGSQGPGILPHPGQSLNPLEGRELGYFGTMPKSFESLSARQGPPPTSLADPRGASIRAPQLPLEGQFGAENVARSNETAMFRDQRSVDGGSFRHTFGNEPNFLRMNGDVAPDSSMFGSRDEKSKTLGRDHLRPFMMEPGSLDKGLHGQNYHAGSELDSVASGQHSRFMPLHYPSTGRGPNDNFGPGPEFGLPHTKHFAPRSPDGEYRGISPRGFGGPSSFPGGSSTHDNSNAREARRFGDGSRSFNPPSDLGRNPFRDGRFAPMPGPPRRGDIDSSGNLRFGEHMAPGLLHGHIRNNDVFGQDGLGHLMRREYPGQGYLPGHFNMSETTGAGAVPGHTRGTEFGGPENFPGMRNSYPHQGFRNAGNFGSGIDSFDQPRKRPMSTGWCRICKVDCETVEGLEMHSQTREHQKASMDMVKMIKQQNRKKQRTSAGHFMREGGRTRKLGLENRGNKP